MTNWVTLGSDVMRDARKRKGLSYEAVGRLINVSSKTYERHEKRGAVPEQDVEAYARVLGLHIERPAMTTVTLEPEQGTDDAVLRLLQDLDDRLRSLEATVGGLATATDVETGMDALRAAIDRVARRHTRAVAQSSS